MNSGSTSPMSTSFKDFIEKASTCISPETYCVEHSIASMNYDKEMSPQRYKNFMAAESAYVDLFLPPLERPSQLLRLSVRTVRQYRRYENKIFSRITWQYLLQKIVPDEGTPAGTLAAATQRTGHPSRSRRPDDRLGNFATRLRPFCPGIGESRVRTRGRFSSLLIWLQLQQSRT